MVGSQFYRQIFGMYIAAFPMIQSLHEILAQAYLSLSAFLSGSLQPNSLRWDCCRLRSQRSPKNFDHDLIQSAYQLQQDLNYADTLFQSITGETASNSGLSDEELQKLSAKVVSLEETIKADAAREPAPAPAECADCATQAETLKQYWVQAADLLKQTETQLSFAEGLRTVRNAELEGLKTVPVSASGTRLYDADLIVQLQAKRQVHVQAANGFIGLRSNAASDADKSGLESIITGEQKAVAELDNEISVVPNHDNTLMNDASFRVGSAETEAAMNYNKIQRTANFLDFILIRNPINDLRNSLNDFLAGLPQEDNTSTTPTA